MKNAKLLLTASIMSIAMGISAFAGSWQQDSVGWWYQNDDGSYPVNTWQWIDGDHDGTYEKYYFNENGYCLIDTTTPDGQTVNVNGALVINETIQTQTSVALQQEAPTTASTSHTGIASSPYDGYTIIANTNTKKYHVPSCKSVKQMKDKNKGYCNDAAYLESHGYSACKNCH